MKLGKASVLVVFILATVACAPRERHLSGDFGAGIVHGRVVKENNERASSVVALFIQRENHGGLCTATILSSDTLLTAAHCVDGSPKKMTVVFGAKIKSTAMDFQRPVEASLQHPTWNSKDRDSQGDVAIVNFSGGLPEGYEPVKLASKATDLNVGTEVLLMGYGVTGLGDRGAGTLRETKTVITGMESSSEIRTDGEKHSVCFGDSGGPAFVQSGDHYVQWGIASGVSNKACNDISVHTNVIVYEAWIRKAAADLRKAVSTRSQ